MTRKFNAIHADLIILDKQIGYVEKEEGLKTVSDKLEAMYKRHDGLMAELKELKYFRCDECGEYKTRTHKNGDYKEVCNADYEWIMGEGN